MASLKLSIGREQDVEEEGGIITMTDICDENGPTPTISLMVETVDDTDASTSAPDFSQTMPAPISVNAIKQALHTRSGSDGMELEFDSKKAKIDYYSKDCTAITDFLFLAGQKVASNESKLKEKGITHIVNAAGDICDNYFPDQFHYLKLHLLDSAQEDIMCVLYKVIDFIDAARKEKNRILVHCQQGVSRSTILVIGYLMYLNNSDYDAMYEYVRARRGVCRPNVGFMCQLLAWRKRVTRTAGRPHCLYRISPHNIRDRALVPKWVDRIDVDSLDSRTLFLLQVNSTDGGSNDSTPKAADSPSRLPASNSPHTRNSSASLSTINRDNPIFIWVGNLCPKEMERLYIPYLAHLISKIQTVEHAGRYVVVIRQRGREKIEKFESMRAAANNQLNGIKKASTNTNNSSRSPSASPTPYSAANRPTTSGSTPNAANGRGSPSPYATSPHVSSPSTLRPTSSHHHGHVSPSPTPSFSSEHISASFHQLESAPQLLAASSLSSLYPNATPRETSQFYKIMGLEESDDYSRVGSDHLNPISSAILLNDDLDEDYPDICVPQPDANLEQKLKCPLPPIVKVGSKRRAAMSAMAAAADDDEEEEMNDEDIAARFNRAPSQASAAEVLPLTLSFPGRPRIASTTNSGANSHRDPAIQMLDDENNINSVSASPRTFLPLSLPKKFSLLHNTNSDSANSTPRTPIQIISTIGGSTQPSTASTPVRPKLQLGFGVKYEPDNEEGENEISTIPVMETADESTIETMIEADEATDAVATGEESRFHLFQFPEFEGVPSLPLSRDVLVSPNIFLLYDMLLKTIDIWMPPPGSLFLPSKYEGDRDAFAGDIAKMFQLATGVEVNNVNVEIAGKESEAFLQALPPAA